MATRSPADDPGATTAAVTHRISLPAFIERPGFVAKEPLREGPQLEPAALVARLEQLLHSDPALFLERYGEWLLQEELAPFEGGGYECTWHLARLRRSTQQREQERRNAGGARVWPARARIDMIERRVWLGQGRPDARRARAERLDALRRARDHAPAPLGL